MRKLQFFEARHANACVAVDGPAKLTLTRLSVAVGAKAKRVDVAAAVAAAESFLRRRKDLGTMLGGMARTV